jgi:hypothetical protein
VEPFTSSETAKSRIIQHRFDNGLPTILITTKNERQISELIGEAMVMGFIAKSVQTF